MTERRKISIRKILQMFTTLMVTLGCIIAIVSASKVEDRKLLKRVAIHIKNNKKYHFIEQNEVMDKAITNRHIDIMNIPVGKLDLQTMEQVLRADPWIAEAQIFIDNDCVLNLYVTQRIPIARLFTQYNGSCYMDTSLSLMPLSANYIYYTTVVTNVPDLKNDSSSNSLKKQIFDLVKAIQADTFWNAQISQVVIDSDRTFELVPVLGNQKIIFGDTAMMKNKLDNLFAFYKNVLNRIGWDKYEVLDLRYKNQVIATPSLPYNGPIDKNVASMNWITTIMETEVKNETVDSLNEDDNDIITEPLKTDSLNKKHNTEVVKSKPKELNKKDKLHKDEKPVKEQRDRNNKKKPFREDKRKKPG